MSKSHSCAVVGCRNDYRRLNRWKEQICKLHGFNYGVGRCICPPPFELIPFPTERQNPERRNVWINNMRRKDKKTGQNWIPKYWSRVCSIHFPDGKVTDKNPYPVLHLGYEPKEITNKHKNFVDDAEDPECSPRKLTKTDFHNRPSPSKEKQHPPAKITIVTPTPERKLMITEEDAQEGRPPDPDDQVMYVDGYDDCVMYAAKKTNKPDRKVKGIWSGESLEAPTENPNEDHENGASKMLHRGKESDKTRAPTESPNEDHENGASKMLHRGKESDKTRLASSKALELFAHDHGNMAVLPQSVQGAQAHQASQLHQQQGLATQKLQKLQQFQSTAAARLALAKGLQQVATLNECGQIHNITVQQTDTGQYNILAGFTTPQLSQLQQEPQEQRLVPNLTPQISPQKQAQQQASQNLHNYTFVEILEIGQGSRKRQGRELGRKDGRISQHPDNVQSSRTEPIVADLLSIIDTNKTPLTNENITAEEMMNTAENSSTGIQTVKPNIYEDNANIYGDNVTTLADLSKNNVTKFVTKFRTSPKIFQDMSVQADLGKCDIIKVNSMRQVLSDLLIENTTLRNKIKSDSSIFTENMFRDGNDRDGNVNFYTGFDTYENLMNFVRFMSHVKKHNEHTMKGLSTFQEILLVLMKLKLKLPNKLLGHMFCIREISVDGIYHRVLIAMCNKIKVKNSTDSEKFPPFLKRYIKTACNSDCLNFDGKSKSEENNDRGEGGRQSSVKKKARKNTHTWSYENEDEATESENEIFERYDNNEIANITESKLSADQIFAQMYSNDSSDFKVSQSCGEKCSNRQITLRRDVVGLFSGETTIPFHLKPEENNYSGEDGRQSSLKKKARDNTLTWSYENEDDPTESENEAFAQMCSNVSSDFKGSQSCGEKCSNRQIPFTQEDIPFHLKPSLRPHKKRKMLTYEEKYKILKEVDEKVLSQLDICKKYRIPQNTLSTWIKYREKISIMASS